MQVLTRFLQETVEFLGHVISSQGIRTSPKKVEVVKVASTPKNITEFLGIVNYYGKFIAGLANICAPLNELLWKATIWRWSGQLQQTKTRIIIGGGAVSLRSFRTNQSCLSCFGARIGSCIISPLERWIREGNTFCITYTFDG